MPHCPPPLVEWALLGLESTCWPLPCSTSPHNQAYGGSEAPTPRWCLGQNNQNNFSVLHFEHKWTPPPRISMKFYIRLIPCSPTKPELKAMDSNIQGPIGPPSCSCSLAMGGIGVHTRYMASLVSTLHKTFKTYNGSVYHYRF